MSDSARLPFCEATLRNQIHYALASGWTQSQITQTTREIQSLLYDAEHAFPFGFCHADFLLAQQLASGIPQRFIAWNNGKQTGAYRQVLRRILKQAGAESPEDLYFIFWRKKYPLLPIAWKSPELPLTQQQVILLIKLWSTPSIADIARQDKIPPTNLHGRVSDLMKKLGLRSRIELARYWKEVLEPTLPQG